MNNNSFAKKAILFLLLVFTVAAVSCDTRKYKLPKKDFEIVTADGRTITVNAELAVKPEERNYGFMNRKKIPAGTGMLFVFEKDQILNFYMKNTPTPLSIAYIDSTGTIRDIFNMKPYSLADIASTCSVRYALEVPQGWYKENNINVGDKIPALKK